VLRSLIAACSAALALAFGSPHGQSFGSHSWRYVQLGRSVLGRPIPALHAGRQRTAVLVVGCIHGTECAGTAVVRALERMRHRSTIWLVPNLNPDGFARGTRQNGRGVDLNRNFPSEWAAAGRRWDPEYPGPRPASEPETRIAMWLVERLDPRITIWFHQPQALVRAWGGSVPAARRYARLAGLPFRRLPWPAGTAPNWQNHRFRDAASFVVELPPGKLTADQAHRYAVAVLRISE
jgi:murein peptide amidase A